MRSPRLIQCTSGGWLAMSGPEDSVQIGVLAETRSAAEQKLETRMAKWKADLLNQHAAASTHTSAQTEEL
jgi:hypothetical protein